MVVSYEIYHLTIDPFPIIGFYLYHVISADQFNNWTTSDIRRVAEIQIFEKTYLIVIKDKTGLKFKMNDFTLFLIGSYAQKLVASY